MNHTPANSWPWPEFFASAGFTGVLGLFLIAYVRSHL
jgi:hypothetical protein